MPSAVTQVQCSIVSTVAAMHISTAGTLCACAATGSPRAAPAAIALAVIVFPVPGSPSNSSPRRGVPPICSARSAASSLARSPETPGSSRNGGSSGQRLSGVAKRGLYRDCREPSFGQLGPGGTL